MVVICIFLAKQWCNYRWSAWSHSMTTFKLVKTGFFVILSRMSALWLQLVEVLGDAMHHSKRVCDYNNRFVDWEIVCDDNQNITFMTAADWAAALGWETSTTWMRSWDSAISSNVALKAATNCVGSFWMNPTVSVNRTCIPSHSFQAINSWDSTIRSSDRAQQIQIISCDYTCRFYAHLLGGIGELSLSPKNIRSTRSASQYKDI